MEKKSNIQRTLETKEKLIYAGAKIITEKGFSKLTLDEVAKEAGVSKGGLLHHFKSKDLLISEIGRSAIKKWEELFDFFYAQETEEKGRFMRAYIKSSLDEECADKEILFSKKVTMAFMSQLFENPSLISIYTESKLTNMELIKKDQLDIEIVNIIRLTVDGIVINELFHTPFDKETRKKIEKKLLEMTRF